MHSGCEVAFAMQNPVLQFVSPHTSARKENNYYDWLVIFNIKGLKGLLRHGSQIRSQFSAGSPNIRPQPKVIITIVMIMLKLWPAAGCETKVVTE